MAHRLVARASLLLWFVMVGSSYGGERLSRVDDYMRVEDISDSAKFSPDGQAVVVVRSRSRLEFLPGLKSDPNRQDVWLQERPTKPLRNLTRGAEDRSGWWAPDWSPDGRRLLTLSTRNGGVTAWVWERATDTLRQVSTKELVVRNACVWVDNRRIMCLGAREGEGTDPLLVEERTIQRAVANWDRAFRDEATASVVDSLEFKHPPQELVLIDVDSGKTSKVVDTIAPLDPRAAGSWWLSPEGRTVAAVRPGPTRYGLGTLWRMGIPMALQIQTVDGNPLRLKKALPDNVLLTTIQWSPNGKELAFFAYGEVTLNPLILYGPAAAEVMPERMQSIENPAKLWRVNVETGTVEQVSTGELSLGYLGGPAFSWTHAGELLFHAPRRRYDAATLNNIPRTSNRGAPVGPTMPLEWMVLSRNGTTRSLTAELKSTPAELISVDDGITFLGIEGGDIWQIEATTGRVTNITATFGPKITWIPSIGDVERPIYIPIRAQTQPHEATEANGSVRIDSELAENLYLMNLKTHEIVLQKRPSQAANLMASSPMTSSLIYTSDNAEGIRVWRTDGEGETVLLAEMNAFLRDTVKAKQQVIQFVDLQGRRLKASLLLPPDYQPGRRYPLVVELYMGFSDQQVSRLPEDPLSKPGVRDAIASMGYAYLVPAMPENIGTLDMEEGPSIFMASSAVLPAVEKVLAMGVADADRLFAWGASHGGWSVAGLVTQTARFKAAAAVAGTYNAPQLNSTCGALHRSLYLRHSINPHEYTMPTPNCKYLFPTDVPWWRDMERVRRNSPMTYVDRIQTPLLLIHGDLDPNCPFEQAEEFFGALVAMRKPARFVRYWGEGHAYRVPANVRDQYRRIFAWFDDYGDIARDASGKMIFEGDRVKSRNGSKALSADDFARFGTASEVELGPTSVSR